MSISYLKGNLTLFHFNILLDVGYFSLCVITVTMGCFVEKNNVIVMDFPHFTPVKTTVVLFVYTFEEYKFTLTTMFFLTFFKKSHFSFNF